MLPGPGKVLAVKDNYKKKKVNKYNHNSNKYESSKDKIRNLIEMEIGSRWQSGKVLAPEQYGDGGTAQS